jgi:heavy metal translocating P-type ATPase
VSGKRARASTPDIAVSHPRDGRMELVSRYFFADATSEPCRQLIERLLQVEEVRAVDVVPSRARAEIEYVNGVVPWRQVVGKIARHLRNGHGSVGAAFTNSPRDLPLSLVDGGTGWRVERHGRVLSTWEVTHELPGRIRLRNRLIARRPPLCAAVERALLRTRGFERCRANPRTATALIVFAPDTIERERLIQILDRALVDGQRADHEGAPARPAIPSPGRKAFAGHAGRVSTRSLALLSLSVGVAAIGELVYPPLGLLAATGALFVTRDTFLHALRGIARERTLTTDAVVIASSFIALAYGYSFIVALTASVWPYTRHVLYKVKQESRADYTDVFRLQARTVWLRVDGVEIETPLEDVKVGDVVAINAGQTIPVDGRVAEGVASVDQHILTGEATPVERGVEDPVFALTVVLSGKIHVRVEKTGAATAAAHIAHVLDRTVDFKTGRQLRAEQMADRLVLPAFLSGLVAWPLLGFGAGVSLLDAHPKYKTTLASSFGLLNYFKIATRDGLLIKDGRTLELLHEVDTVVFDKTGTLTLAQPHVARVYACAPRTAAEVLALAAAAEQHQSHPIAIAILQAARTRAVPVPAMREADYKVGYGLTVTIEASTIRVGSMRFMEMEAIRLPRALAGIQARCHEEGHSLTLVAVDDAVVGAIELHTSVRPEARRVVDGLRRRGIRSMYIISGDHEAPTRQLAEALGIEHYFAETLPEDKAAVIEGLQEAGKVVCYVGDGINDSIAMKKSHVSVSLRGASTLATDTAEVILLDESLNQLGRLVDIARECRTNTTATMASVLVPSIVCVCGVLLGTFTFAHARLLNIAGLVAGVGVAMLPRLTHRPSATTRAEPTPTHAEAAIEECVIDGEVDARR